MTLKTFEKMFNKDNKFLEGIIENKTVPRNSESEYNYAEIKIIEFFRKKENLIQKYKLLIDIAEKE